MKGIDKSIVSVAVLVVALSVTAWIFESYRGHLLSIAGFVTFLVVLQIIDERFSKSPFVGRTCFAVTNLNPGGKIDFAEETIDAKAAKGFSIKSGQECVIIDFKRGVFTKGIYIVRPVEEKTES